MAKRLIDTVISVVDLRRFPWLSRDGQHREPTEVERDSAILASAAIIATRDAEKLRRSESKDAQESLTLFWSHSLETQLLDWLDSIKSA